jgi:hypothetical protein
MRNDQIYRGDEEINFSVRLLLSQKSNWIWLYAFRDGPSIRQQDFESSGMLLVGDRFKHVYSWGHYSMLRVIS